MQADSVCYVMYSDFSIMKIKDSLTQSNDNFHSATIYATHMHMLIYNINKHTSFAVTIT